MRYSMRPWTVGGLVLGLLVFCMSDGCLAGSGVYVGIGGSYAESRINDSIINDDDLEIPIEFGEAYGFNARLGGRLIDLLALELNFDYITGFEASKVFTVLSLPVGATADLDIMTLMATAKLIPLQVGPAEFRLLAGAGIMRAEMNTDINTTIAGESLHVSVDDTLPCGEIGLGLGFALGDRAALGIEGTYVAGFGDFADEDYGIGYTLVTAGVDFFF